MRRRQSVRLTSISLFDLVYGIYDSSFLDIPLARLNELVSKRTPRPNLFISSRLQVKNCLHMGTCFLIPLLCFLAVPNIDRSAGMSTAGGARSDS